MDRLIFPDLSFELNLWEAGLEQVAGLDEAGRGAWAGPVFAAAVILPKDSALCQTLCGVRDSKLMTPKQRDYWAEIIKDKAADWAIGSASNQEIDEYGILFATRLAMSRALAQLRSEAQHLLIDAVHLTEEDQPQTILIKGDRRCLSVAAASVLAKTARDAVMSDLDQQFPRYGFRQNKGYGTAFHRKALQQFGTCPYHRLSFAPMNAIYADVL